MKNLPPDILLLKDEKALTEATANKTYLSAVSKTSNCAREGKKTYNQGKVKQEPKLLLKKE